MVKHDYYAALAAEKNTVKQTIYAERGAIYDTNNEILAQNVPVETVVADGTLMNNRAALVPILAKALQTSAPTKSAKRSAAIVALRRPQARLSPKKKRSR